MADLNYIESGYFTPDSGYFVYTADAASAVNSTSSVSCDVNKVSDAVSTITVSFTQSTYISKTSDIDLYAFSEAAIAVQVDRLRAINTDATSVFSVAIDTTRTQYASSEADAIFSAIVNGLRSRDVNIETQAAFSFDVSVDRIRDASSEVNTQVDLTTAATKLNGFSPALYADSSLTIDGTVEQGIVIDLGLAEFTVNALVDKVKESSASIDSITEFTAVISNAHGTDITVNNFASVAIEISVIYDNQVNLLSEFNTDGNVGKLKLTSVNVNSYFSIFTSKYFGDLRPRNGAQMANGIWDLSNTTFVTSPVKFGTHSLKNPKVFETYPFIDSKLGVKPNQAFVFELWYYNNAHYSASASGFGVGSNRTLANWWLRPLTDGNITYSAIDNTGFTTSGTSTGAPIQLNSWNHILLVAQPYSNSVNDVAVFINGNKVLNWFRPSTNGDLTQALSIRDVGTNGHVDDISYHVGSTLGYSTTAATITVPSAKRENNAYTKLIWRLDNNGNDDLSTTQLAQAALSSVSSVSATLSGPVRISAGLNSVATISARVNATNDCEMTAFSNGAMNIVATRIEPLDATLTAQSSLTVPGAARRSASSNISSNFTCDATILNIKQLSSDIAGAFTQTTEGNRTTDIFSNFLFVNTGMVVRAGTNKSIDIVAYDLATLDITVDKLVGVSSTVDTVATVDAVISKIHNAQSSAASEFTQTADAVKTADAVIATESIASELVAVVITAEGVEALNSEFTLEASIAKYAGFTASLENTTDLATDAVKTVDISADFAVVASSLSVVVKTTDIIELAGSSSSLEILFDKIVPLNSALEAAFNLTAIGVTQNELEMYVFSNAELTATLTGDKQLLPSELVSVATFYADTFDSLASVGSADIAATATQTTVAIKTVSAVIATESIASELTVAVKEVAVDITLDATTTLTASIVKLRAFNAELAAASSVSATVEKITDVVDTMLVIVDTSATATRIFDFSVNTSVVATELAAVAKVGTFFINCENAFALSAELHITRTTAAATSATTSISIDADRLTDTVIAVQSQATTHTIIGVIKQYVVDIDSAMNFTANVREIKIDEIVYIIPADVYVFAIDGETRTYSLTGETGYRKIASETRAKNIGSETRIYIV